MKGCVAVFDVGKSNIKLFVFDAAGVILAEHSEGNAPLAPDAHRPYPQLDTERAWAFLLAALKDVGRGRPIEAISTAAHGSAGALLENEALALPPMDYEFGEFGGIDPEYEKARPPYAETLSPSLPRGHNLGRQLFYMQRMFPVEFKRATTFLAYPQYWAWRLSGVAASEATSLGCHTDLWNPGDGRLSSMVDRLGWRGLFPPLRKAWDPLGSLRPEVVAATGLKPDVRVICGAHDSNASLVPYLASRRDPFTVISTGTWIIIMAVGGKGRLDPEADMLANVDVRGLPAPTARFMGGREFAALAGEEPAMVSEADVAAIVAAGVLAVPAFSEQGGPFGGRRKGVVEGSVATASGRAALATLYCALMTAHLVERLEAQGDLIVEGGFNRTPAFAGVLAALLQGRAVFAAPTTGAAGGAAMLAHWGEENAPPRLEAVRGWPIPGMAEYRKRWERRL